MHHSSRSEPILKVTPHPYSPYGIRFEDEKRYHKQQQQRYKEDLDYLISLRQKNNSLVETLREQRRIERMNDKYNYERLNQKSINKEFAFYNTHFYRKEKVKNLTVCLEYPEANIYWYLDFKKYV